MRGTSIVLETVSEHSKQEEEFWKIQNLFFGGT
jgi:hypothetical protein